MQAGALADVEKEGGGDPVGTLSAVTVDDGPRRGRPRSTKRDLERYAGLFASRTQVMKSSAMRDLMAVTARPEVISLAGGCPTRAASPGDVRRGPQRIARESCAGAPVRPTEGLAETKDCIAEVMHADGGMRIDPDHLIVTTGGQQVIDLVTKTLIDPGDVIVAEAPTYPGAVRRSRRTRPTWCRSRWTPTACGSTCSRSASPSSSARAGGRSSSTRSRASRTRPA